MRVFLMSVSVLAVLIAACGSQPDEEGSLASALDVMPDNTLFSIAVVNPSTVISSLDGYASGVTLLGESAISGWILSALDCADMTEVENRLGIRLEGSLVVFMESMMPQSMGAALTVSDPDMFWSNIGVVPEAGEPLEGYDVSFIPVDFGNIYFCHTNGLLLGSGSRAGLQKMLESIDGNLPSDLQEIPDGSFYLYMNIESFGPMIASQLAMMEPQILAEMSSEGDFNAGMMQNIMGMYFDGISLVLNETKSVNFVLSFEQEYITGSSSVEFVPGSSLDQFIVPVEIEDLTGIIPAGNVMVGRFSMNSSTTMAFMNAILGAMGIEDIPQSVVSFWAETSRNTAVSMSTDPENPMHLVAVYEMPEGASLEDVKEVYDIQFAMISEIMEMPGLTLSEVQYLDYEGIEWVTFGMDMDMTAMQPQTEVSDVPIARNVSWTAWMTAQDGILYVEMASEPATVIQIIDGAYQGETAGEMVEMQGFSDSSEIVMLINIPEYVNMAMGMSGLDLPPIEAEPVWMEVTFDFTGGGVFEHFRISGTGLSVFIGQAIQVFGALAQ